MASSKVFCGLAFIAASGCFQDAATLSSFAEVTPTGFIVTDVTGGATQSNIDFTGSGFAYAAGSVYGDGLKAVSGITTSSSVAPAPAAGSTVFSGRYELFQVDGISLSGSQITGFRTQQTGSINLTANFGTGTLTGSSGNLSIDGRFSGEDLKGDVTYRGVDGDLTGLVGSDKAVGAFHGNDADLIYAGGFLVN